MGVVCPCGKYIETTNACPYSLWETDNEGNIIYAVCVHGCVIIQRPIERPKDIFDLKSANININIDIKGDNHLRYWIIKVELIRKGNSLRYQFMPWWDRYINDFEEIINFSSPKLTDESIEIGVITNNDTNITKYSIKELTEEEFDNWKWRKKKDFDEDKLKIIPNPGPMKRLGLGINWIARK